MYLLVKLSIARLKKTKWARMDKIAISIKLARNKPCYAWNNNLT